MRNLNKSSHLIKRPLLIARNALKRSLHDFFERENFTEVETPILQVSGGNETHLHAFKTDLIHDSLDKKPLYLHTSPEFSMKKLLSLGEERIYQFTKTFRNRERSKLHHPEFTMLEWYRAGEPYMKLMGDITEILALTGELKHNNLRADPQKILKISYEKAFFDFAGVRLTHLREDCLKHGYRISHDDTDSDIRSKILTTIIEPDFAQNGSVTLLDRYPIEEAALARPCPDDPRFAERFEVYACGVELVNAFGELTDAKAQRARFIADMADKKRIYGEDYPLDEEFLELLNTMPQASGAALGFDRLVMLMTNAPRIEEVLWLPVVD